MSATTRFDDSNIISEHDTMAVTYQGMAALDFHFFIDREDLWSVEYETFEHMYPWLDETDFDAALAAAKTYHVSRYNAEELAVERDREARRDRLYNSYASVDSRTGFGTLLIKVTTDDSGGDITDTTITLADSEASITYSQSHTADADGHIFVKGLQLSPDNADATYIATFTAVPDGYDTPDPLSIEVAHGNITVEEVELATDEE